MAPLATVAFVARISGNNHSNSKDRRRTSHALDLPLGYLPAPQPRQAHRAAKLVQCHLVCAVNEERTSQRSIASPVYRLK
jgi:hypothetical protein